MSDLHDYTAAMRNGDDDACIAIEQRHGLYGYPPEMVSTVLESLDKDAEIARLIAAKDAEIARLREALSNLLAVAEGQGGTKYHAHDIARAALAPVEVGK